MSIGRMKILMRRNYLEIEPTETLSAWSSVASPSRCSRGSLVHSHLFPITAPMVSLLYFVSLNTPRFVFYSLTMKPAFVSSC